MGKHINGPLESRRAWLVAAASVSAGSLLRGRCAMAQAGKLPHLDARIPIARSLGYVADATKINPKTEPTFKVGSRCANCAQLLGKPGEAWRPCAVFAGQLVSAHGWCRVWIPRPKV
jgi:hypothetical protein